LSVVKKARGGPLCRFNLDAEDIHVDGISFDKVLNFNTVKGEDMIFNKDGKEYEVKDEVHALLTALETEKKEAMDSSATEIAELTAKVDELQAKVDLNESKSATDAADVKFKEAVAARVKLERDASEFVDVSLDGLSDREIKEKVIAKVSKVSLDGKSDVYVDAAFDLALEQAPATEVVDLTNAANQEDSRDIVIEAKDRAWKKALNQWKGE